MEGRKGLRVDWPVVSIGQTLGRRYAKEAMHNREAGDQTTRALRFLDFDCDVRSTGQMGGRAWQDARRKRKACNADRAEPKPKRWDENRGVDTRVPSTGISSHFLWQSGLSSSKYQGIHHRRPWCAISSVPNPRNEPLPIYLPYTNTT